MKQRTFVHAQAYYGTPVGGYRATLVEDVHLQAGGVPFEGDVVIAPVAPKQAKTKAKKA